MPDMTNAEREVRHKMRENELYKDFGPGLEGLEEARISGKEIAREYNLLPLRDHGQRREVLERLFGSVGKDVWVEPPIYVAYGKHIHIGNSVYFNSGTTLVDDSEVIIGDEVMLGPNVTITTAGHPLHPEQRSTGYQFSSKIIIAHRAWIGANATILPGITIGSGSVVAAGAVVTANVPPSVIVGGVPARIIRKITPSDNNWQWKPPRNLSFE